MRVHERREKMQTYISRNVKYVDINFICKDIDSFTMGVYEIIFLIYFKMCKKVKYLNI